MGGAFVPATTQQLSAAKCFNHLAAGRYLAIGRLKSFSRVAQLQLRLAPHHSTLRPPKTSYCNQREKKDNLIKKQISGALQWTHAIPPAAQTAAAAAARRISNSSERSSSGTLPKYGSPFALHVPDIRELIFGGNGYRASNRSSPA